MALYSFDIHCSRTIFGQSRIRNVASLIDDLRLAMMLVSKTNQGPGRSHV